MHRQRNIYQSRMLDLLRNCLSDGQNGGCKQRGQTAIWLKALLMPRLAVCSRDLHWHWINWTLLCDTMEVSMLRLAWLPIAQHVFQPALTGRLELISRKIVSSKQEQRLSRWADFAKNCLPRIECKELPRFRENIALLGTTSAKFAKSVGKKWGPTCDRDISNSAIYTTAIYRAYTVLSLFVRYDGIYFILINHDNFEFIYAIDNILGRVRHDLSTDKLGQVTFEVMACLTAKMMQIAEIYPYFPHATRWKNNAPTITLWIIRFLLLVRDNRMQVIHFNQVIS